MTEAVNWVYDLDEALAAAKAADKLVLLDIFSPT